MTSRSAASLDDLARQLEALASELAQGKLRIGTSLIAVGDPIFLKSKQKLAEGKAYCTLSFQVPLLAEEQRENFPLSPASPTSLPQEHNQILAKPRLGDRPPQGKKIKKELSSLWKSLVRNLTEGRFPTDAEARKLMASSQEYRLFAEPHWQADWLACCDTIQAVLDASKSGDLDLARRLADEVNQRTKSCHKQHK